MTAVILCWNPDKWNWSGKYRNAVDDVREAGRHLQRWPVEQVHNLPPGLDAWLLVHGGRPNQRGLIGHGITVGEPYSADPHDLDVNGGRMYVDVEFDLLLPEGEQVRTEELAARIPGVSWGTVLDSGRCIPADQTVAVKALWAEHLLERREAQAEHLGILPGTYPEGALTRIAVNRYEHSPEARRVAIAELGATCGACGFDFERTYGPEGAGYTHVHHTVPVCQLGPGYELDPIRELVPLCPNCHYMAHRRQPDPYTVAELRAMIAGAGYLPGTVMTNEESAAQEDANRLRNARTPEVG